LAARHRLQQIVAVWIAERRTRYASLSVPHDTENSQVAEPAPISYASLYAISYKGAVVQAPRLDEDIRPLSEFRAGVASFVKRVNDTKRPLVLTQHGRGVAVLMDIQEFEAMRERLALLEDVAVGRAQIAAGEILEHEAARTRVLKRLGG
jgi:antitoxin YefM